MEGCTERTLEDRVLSGPSGESLLCPGGVWEEREEAHREAFVLTVKGQTKSLLEQERVQQEAWGGSRDLSSDLLLCKAGELVLQPGNGKQNKTKRGDLLLGALGLHF